jgi:GTP cyclohydrolase I
MIDRARVAHAIISLGSNIEREQNLPAAVRCLRRHRHIDVEHVSRVYETEPATGAEGGPPFYNAAMLVATDLSPVELRRELRAVEAALGRQRTDDKNAPRTIDLDLAYFDAMAKDFGDWRLPDPEAATAPHVAVPIADVAPDWVHPELGNTMAEIASGLKWPHGPARAVTSLHLDTPFVVRAPEDFDTVDEGYAPRMEELVRQQLLELGEEPEREGLVRTPLRVAKALDFLTSGYSTSVEEAVNGAIFDAEGAEEMVLVRDIEFYSVCEHHMLPFFGKAAIAYLPDKRIIGLSKLARITDVFARRLQVQERLTNQVADAVQQVLDPHGVAVVMDGKHLCMMMRGVQKQESSMVTSAMRGTFKSDARTRNEFLDLIRR